ncbi:lytic transglycosylase domain-containing protein [Capnocytophaga sputigena]|jgi:membrane-bound lytic murein transglycosylase|uniref:Lytic transglycosylase n=1 Tax=Capnocytophaga sputigena TaxID=1019 RepID=A0AAX2IA19_CAPSP|nr:lytic transglycosylase domain-containing protein [Capnocytophaga sputigena]ATA84042.1 lytic transglycosylase [Capnocytophaga sputigena]EEB65503.1 transglycosylase SLT domain protein [Capnocytophaga sputigena ATCC 33612]SQA74994.1 Membrane-bound lytic murein transglycosylase D precursor [Capnocytophaga sputigena]
MKLGKYTLTTLACLLLGSMPMQAQFSQKDTINKNPKREGLRKLNDNPNVRKYDEKWLKELSNSDLFFQMSEDVAATPTDVDYSELPTEVLKERLRKLNEKTPFNVEYNPVLEQVIKSFLKNRRSSLERLMSLSDYYFPMFEQEMSNQKIPLEMKYLAIIESALNPKARSRAGATGLWQFMYATGKSYGLEVNNYVDERSDPVRSTKAAAKYLNELYKIFGDWDLTLAAYNSGPGNVTKAIRRSNGKTNYWNLRPYLPRETAGYVPAFLATLYIFEYAKEHGFKPQKRANHLFQTDTIRVKQAIPFKDIAEITGMDVQDIQFFNPSYQLDVVPYVEGRNYAVRLPISEIGKFVANEQAIYNYLNEQKAQREQILPEVAKGEQYAGGKSTKKTIYTVKKGDNLGKIASRHGVSINNLKRWNRMKSNKVRVGQRLSIYK